MQDNFKSSSKLALPKLGNKVKNFTYSNILAQLQSIKLLKANLVSCSGRVYIILPFPCDFIVHVLGVTVTIKYVSAGP